jgi:MFS family permease
MKTSPLNSLLLLSIWPTTVVVQAFASSPSHKTLLSPPKSFLQKHHQLQHQQQNNHLHTTTTTTLNLFGGHATTTKSVAAAVTNLIPRGGSIADKVTSLASTPNGSFNLALGVLAASTAVLKISNKANSDKDDTKQQKDPKVKSLQLRFLMVFWLLRMADWLQGPYFYQVYASKTFGAATGNAMTWVSRLFLTGFASTALFGPLVGRLCDTYGRKAGTLVFSLLYSLGAMSTKSNILGVLLAGRVMGGIGTSLLFSAPEAWLVGDAARNGLEGSLGETFGLAYAGDSIVAILAGQMAGMAAGSRGPSGPFELSVGFLILGGLLAAFTWKENVAGNVKSGGDDADKDDAGSKPTIRDAVKVVKEDPKIMLVGSIQSLFEAAMYIFVLNWPPAVSKAVSAYFAKFATDSSAAIGTPYGTVFSCFSKFLFCLLVFCSYLAHD